MDRIRENRAFLEKLMSLSCDLHNSKKAEPVTMLFSVLAFSMSYLTALYSTEATLCRVTEFYVFNCCRPLDNRQSYHLYSKHTKV